MYRDDARCVQQQSRRNRFIAVILVNVSGWTRTLAYPDAHIFSAYYFIEAHLSEQSVTCKKKEDRAGLSIRCREKDSNDNISVSGMDGRSA